MRTTIDIPDPVYRQLKSKAGLEGRSVKELILQWIDLELNGKHGQDRSYRVKLPLIRNKNPGSLKLTNAQINALLFP
jgi:hypothetical protein